MLCTYCPQHRAPGLGLGLFEGFLLDDCPGPPVRGDDRTGRRPDFCAVRRDVQQIERLHLDRRHVQGPQAVQDAAVGVSEILVDPPLGNLGVRARVQALDDVALLGELVGQAARQRRVGFGNAV